MIYAILIVFLLAAAISFFEDYLEERKVYLYVAIGVVLILLAGLRPIGFDLDSENYELYYIDYDKPIYTLLVEFSYLFLAQILNTFTQDVHILFLLYAILGITLKFIAFKKLTPFIFLAVALYISNYYLLHDMTQIRVAISSGLLLLSISYICNQQKQWAALLYAIAICFHYSSIVLLPLLLLSNKEMEVKERVAWGALIPIAYLLYFAHINIIMSLPIPFIQNKLEMYDTLKDVGMFSEVNVFNMVLLARIVIYCYLLFMYDLVKEYSPYLSLMLKIVGISLFSFIAFSDIPVLSFRISELFGIVEVVLYTYIVYTIKPASIARLLVLTICLVFLYANLFHAPILNI